MRLRFVWTFSKLHLCSQTTNLCEKQTVHHSIRDRWINSYGVTFFISREGEVGFYPIFGQRLPTLLSLRSPIQTLGCQCGFTGSTGPATTTRINLTSLWTVGDSSVFDYTRLKACQLTDLAPTLNPSDRRKRVECPSAAVEFSFADFSCRVVMSSFSCLHIVLYNVTAKSKLDQLYGEQRRRRNKHETKRRVYP